jgi:hypothetical protein
MQILRNGFIAQGVAPKLIGCASAKIKFFASAKGRQSLTPKLANGGGAGRGRTVAEKVNCSQSRPNASKGEQRRGRKLALLAKARQWLDSAFEGTVQRHVQPSRSPSMRARDNGFASTERTGRGFNPPRERRFAPYMPGFYTPKIHSGFAEQVLWWPGRGKARLALRS